MKLHTLLFGVRFFTVIAIGAFVSVILLIDPETSGVPGVVFFFASLFASITGFVSLLLIALMRRFLGDETTAVSIGGSFRQGALLAGFVVGLLALSHFRMLLWWTALLAFTFVLLLEFTARRLGEEER